MLLEFIPGDTGISEPREYFTELGGWFLVLALPPLILGESLPPVLILRMSGSLSAQSFLAMSSVCFCSPLTGHLVQQISEPVSW